MPGAATSIVTPALVERVAAVVREAGAVVLGVYGGAFAVRGKADRSPVTLADELAEAHVVAAIEALTPGVPIVAEEAFAAGRAPVCGDRFWLVDALDGTREFVEKNGEFTVNVALVEAGVAVLGVVQAPAVDALYAGARGVAPWLERGGAARVAIRCRGEPAPGATVLASRAAGDGEAIAAFLAGRRVAGTRRAGSSLKLCLVAEGVADLYPRFGRTMEWDIAAGQAIVEAAGGSVVDLEGRALRYGKPGFVNPSFVCAGLAGA